MRFRSLDDVPASLEESHPGSRWLRWRPVRREPGWLVRLDFGKSEFTPADRPIAECIGVEVRSFREEADGGWPDWLPLWDGAPAILYRRTLRDLPLGQMLDDLADEVLEIQMEWAKAFRIPLGDDEDDAAALRDAQQIEAYVSSQRSRGRGKRPRGVPDLKAVASVYLNAKKNERTKTVAAKFGVSQSTAAKWIMRARNEGGLLPPPTNRPRPKGKDT